jgi:uncharacterized protein (TIGR00299 family) protein
MLLGALLDAGLPLDALREALGSLAIDDYTLDARRVLRAGVSATKFVLDERHPNRGEAVSAATGRRAHDASHVHGHGSHAHDEAHGHDHGHELDHHDHTGEGHAHGHEGGHSQGHHPHRSLHEIEQRIARSALAPAARDRAVALFRRLAEAEAAVHDVPVDRVHLHEVGALDSIIDIVGGVFGLEWFGATRIVASPLNLGRGMVQCAHGTFPVPAPATARLVAGVPVYQEGPAVELTTPTGALLVTGFADDYGPMPAMRVSRTGYGAGTKDFKERPNVFRVFVGTADEAAARGHVTVLEFELDDMNPQLYGVLMDQLLAAGALDVFYAAVQMKKNRPGTLVTVLSPPDRRDALARIVFRETTTLGVRYHDMRRDCLAREHVVVDTPWGAVAVKVGRLGGDVTSATPEFDDCVRVARAAGVAVKDVQAAAQKAWLDRTNH